MIKESHTLAVVIEPTENVGSIINQLQIVAEREGEWVINTIYKNHEQSPSSTTIVFKKVTEDAN